MNTVKLRLIRHGERSVDVDVVDYRTALAGGVLDELLEQHAEDTEVTTVVVAPEGRLTELSLRGHTRPSLLGADPTAALAAVIGVVRPRPYCGTCARSRPMACPQHIAEELVAAARHEDLVIMTAADADAALALAVRNAAGS